MDLDKPASRQDIKHRREARLAILIRRMKLRAAEQAGAGSNRRTMAQYGIISSPLQPQWPQINFKIEV
jgi:hypothetical protein